MTTPTLTRRLAEALRECVQVMKGVNTAVASEANPARKCGLMTIGRAREALAAFDSRAEGCTQQAAVGSSEHQFYEREKALLEQWCRDEGIPWPGTASTIGRAWKARAALSKEANGE